MLCTYLRKATLLLWLLETFLLENITTTFFLAENHARQTKTMLNSTRPDQLRSVASFTCYCKPLNNFNIFAFFFLQANQTKIRV